MTNIGMVEGLLDELGYAPDPGFNGELARWEGEGVLVVGEPGLGVGVELQVYVLNDGEPELIKVERPGTPAHLTNRINDLDGILRFLRPALVD